MSEKITPSFVQVQLVHGEIFLEDPEISHDLKLSRINNSIIFRNDCLLRYKRLLTPIFAVEHREKIRKYIKDQEE